ncbi:hypothetical protein [Sphaerospermopsis torques-reginae]|uniref:Uncharacterized protein n=1 Tax=Sphaerospermopsis torques-reginae ITEP-024 TaxID=984208 RepID=A0ABX8WZR9_9CYAN|nr:hypothetical protein [Sphaerospermopsis torques-reginae]QYX31870.1 hypothetical protein K2F26_24435 [Sphaerospermopsis torques-reginae ITEP-024]
MTCNLTCKLSPAISIADIVAVIQFNIPSRPRVLVSQLESRGNEISESCGYTCQSLKLISTEELITIAEQIQKFTKIPVRYPILGDR